MIRLRSLLEDLSYDDLVRQGVIPDLVSVLAPALLVTKRYAPFVYASKAYSEYGMFMDYVVRAGLRTRISNSVDWGSNPTVANVDALHKYQTSNNFNDIVRSAHQLVTEMYEGSQLSESDLQASVPILVNICKALAQKWETFAPYLTGTVRYNAEHGCDDFFGHPDIDTDIVTLDIKTTASFGKMSQEACLQVLGYYALRKLTTPSMRYVGFVLPMQRELALYDVSTWNSSPYLDLLKSRARAATPSLREVVSEVFAALFQPDLMTPVGFHIHKGKTISTSVCEFAARRPHRPCQLFLTNPRTGKRSASTAAQVTAAAVPIRNQGITVFIHAPYVINLCANQTDITDGVSVPWQQNILNEDLRLGSIMGCKGVVVHTGAQGSKSYQEAYNTMYQMVATALQHATEDCKLLLETPCGEGTEICTTVDTLGNFVMLFNQDQHKKLGLCVDTCHVFAAGFDPLEYMKHWTLHVPVPICLVHFNDSKDPQGSHRDRHTRPGTGHIGYRKLQAISDWCVSQNIPMVVE